MIARQFFPGLSTLVFHQIFCFFFFFFFFFFLSLSFSGFSSFCIHTTLINPPATAHPGSLTPSSSIYTYFILISLFLATVNTSKSPSAQHPMQCIAPWIPAFKSALASESESFVSFSFATIDAKKLVPRVRTCVYRGFLFNDESTNSIIFTTDDRSLKQQELLNNNNFEACFYFKNANKQFRFNGSANVISINRNLYPQVVLPDIANTPYEEDGYDDDDLEDQISDDDDESKQQQQQQQQQQSSSSSSSSQGHPVLHKSGSTCQVFQLNSADQRVRGGNINTNNSNNNNLIQTAGDISAPINYPLFSPSSLHKIQQELEENNNSHGLSLNELLTSKPEILYPPTVQDYQNEFHRAWDLLSPKSKSSFKHPKPRTSMNEDKRKLIDRISRGVDGKSINEGQKQFAVVVLLIDKVDYYKDSYGNSKRLLYERVNFDQWKENEIVP